MAYPSFAGFPVDLSIPAALDVPVIAGETIAAFDSVYLELNGGLGTPASAYRTDGSVVTKSSSAWVAGIAMTSAGAGSTFMVRVAGLAAGLTGRTAGAPQYASATPGALTETAPTNVLLVGIALSTTTMLVNTRGANTVPLLTGISGTKGYVAGGNSSTTIADKLVFATDTMSAQTSANLTVARFDVAGASDGSTKCYWAGGYDGTRTALVDKTVLSTDTTTALGATLSSGCSGKAGLSERTTKAYFAGGYNGGYTNITDKITTSGDTIAAVTSANLSTGRQELTGVNGGATKGYFCGGATTGYLATTDKVVFSSDTLSAIGTADLSTGRGQIAGMSDGAIKGFIEGGYNGGDVATGDKLIFSTDTTSAVSSSNLSGARGGSSGLSQGSTKGYACGGYNGSFLAITDKTVYATDTTSAQSSANLSTARDLTGAASDVGL